MQNQKQNQNRNQARSREMENVKGNNLQTCEQNPLNPNDKTRESSKKNGAENMKDNNEKPEA